MSDAAASINGTTAVLKGALVHASVPALYRQLSADIGALESIDLAAVEHSDSAGIALLLELKRLHHGALQISNMPTQMQDVARACGVAGLLDQATA